MSLRPDGPPKRNNSLDRERLPDTILGLYLRFDISKRLIDFAKGQGAIMRNTLATICRLLAIMFVSAPIVQPAFAQQLSGDNADYVTAGYATRLSRYYAPYALQAKAAYVDVALLDATRGPAKQPSLDGSDVRLAVGGYDGDVTQRATKYLQAWQYQFGSDGYLTCFEADPECLKAIQKDRWTFATPGGPAFHVWARTRFPQKEGASCSEVSIAFRGTVLSMSDWISNLDPVTGFATDNHYRQLRRNIDAIIKKITTLDCYRRAKNRPQIVSVGHSLGAGLAQFSGLANHPGRPRITKVFAFDPSPITGAGYVDKQVLAQNAAGLEIDRIYQSGEALQGLRKYAQQFPKSNAPCVRTVVLDLLRPTGPVGLHNISGLTREIIQSSYEEGTQQAFKKPWPLTTCSSRYAPPATDQDEYQEPAADRLLVSNRRGSAIRFARAKRNRTVAYAMANGPELVSRRK
ncbi:MAG: hypothetical protein ABI561_25075 [Bradyrhizobium sp.]